MSLNPNAALVAERLKQAGYTRGQIAGVLGNIQVESGFNPRVNEGGIVGAPLGKGGYGFPQWTGGRQKNLINFAKQKKLDPGDPGLQADFLLHELSGSERLADKSLRGAISPEESARRFLVDFERAGVPKAKQRQQAARDIYEKREFADLFSPPTSTPTVQTPKDERSVDQILSSSLGLQLKPNFENTKDLASSLKDSFKEAILGSLIPSLSSPGLIPKLPSMFGLLSPF